MVKPAAIQNDHLAAALANVSNKPLELGQRTKNDGCAVNGPLPDPACTPGDVFPDAQPQHICISGYTKSVRNVSVNLKKKVYAEYGLVYPQPRGYYEVDHLIPLELGGSNDIANLFPEAAQPAPGFHEKDLVENYLNHQLCAGKISLAGAQEQIAKDWVEVYQSLTPTQLQELRQEFNSWSGN